MDGLFSIAYAARLRTAGLSMGGDPNIATVTPAVRVFLTHIICSLQLSAALPTWHFSHIVLQISCPLQQWQQTLNWNDLVLVERHFKGTVELVEWLVQGGKELDRLTPVCLSVFLYVRLKRFKRFARTSLTALTFLFYSKHFQWHRGIWSQNLTSNIAPTSPPRQAQTHHHCQ